MNDGGKHASSSVAGGKHASPVHGGGHASPFVDGGEHASPSVAGGEHASPVHGGGHASPFVAGSKHASPVLPGNGRHTKVLFPHACKELDWFGTPSCAFDSFSHSLLSRSNCVLLVGS